MPSTLVNKRYETEAKVAMKRMKSRLPDVRARKTDFDELISKQKSSSEHPLPLTHTTDAYDLRDILAGGSITPRPCPVFNRDLIYTFYGRPAYRKNGNVQANNIAAYAPIILVLDPKCSEEGSMLFPFDSGAFRSEFYDDVRHHKMRVEDFGLHPSYERIGKLIGCFYGSNLAYFDQKPIAPELSSMDYEGHTYSHLINSRGKNERDDRSASLELIFERLSKLLTTS